MERVELLSNAPRRIEVETGTTIRVEHGRVWLTLTDLAQDIVLPAGQAFRAPHAGRVVVEAWDKKGSSAAIAVMRPERSADAAGRPVPHDGRSLRGDRHAVEYETARGCLDDHTV